MKGSSIASWQLSHSHSIETHHEQMIDDVSIVIDDHIKNQDVTDGDVDGSEEPLDGHIGLNLAVVAANDADREMHLERDDLSFITAVD